MPLIFSNFLIVVKMLLVCIFITNGEKLKADFTKDFRPLEMEGGINFHERSVNEKEFLRNNITPAFRDKEMRRGLYSQGNTNLGKDNIWYLLGISVSDEGEKFNDVHIIDIEKKLLLDSWEYSLNWPDRYISNEFLERLDENQKKQGNYYFNVINDGACIKKQAMYGDIDNDGQSEIVMFRKGRMDILSLLHKQIIFSEEFTQSDWLDPKIVKDYHHALDNAQYVAASSGSDRYFYNPALRSYSKMYINDFDQDGNQDIVTWRKTYKTNKAGEEKGFHKISETFLHYEFDAKAQAKLPAGVTGDFLPQSTSAEKIQSWIKPSLETWQSGYPSRSDCGDQKGELIPAFHDANLNDPQVGNIVIPEPESAHPPKEEVQETKAETEVEGTTVIEEVAKTEPEAVMPEKIAEEVVEKVDVAEPVDSAVIPDSGKKLTPKLLIALLAILGFIIFLVLRARSKKS